MQESAGSKRRVWFLLKVVLLFIGALVWLLSARVTIEVAQVGTGAYYDVPEVWVTISVILIYIALPISTGILSTGIYGLRYIRKAQVAETKPRLEPTDKGGCLTLVFAIVALVPAPFIFAGTVSDPTPESPYAVRLVILGLLFLIWGLVTGYVNPHLWLVSGVITLGMWFFFLPVALGVALSTGYWGSVLRRSGVIPRLFRRK